ncbi:ATP-binding cassette domain-containing protein [uncultured Vagococcus sp.]|uniref:ATP-binding cassette domain-containing protein n=1 Tax=uncultured Vagococcus sp. TaxID=189676 RepID=UPI0028D6AC7C|nr:ATP-binding cassette domain-containing protein [uncultured Vagococcus sp.]
MTVIVIQNVSKIIQKNQVLSDISVKMLSGKIYGLQGINGSGKTMLMRTIIGLIRPTEGEVIIDGKVIGKDIEFPQSIGFLLESPSFLNRYSGIKNLRMLASFQKKIGIKEILATLDLVGLDEEASQKKYQKYSLGMKQRLGIAAAIMEKPDIVILDEPTNSLDTDGVILVKDILQKQKERGALIIIACHEPQILKELSDTIIKLETGKVVSIETLD